MPQKTRTEIRLDPRVHERAKQLAAEAGISVNQLLEGVITWAMGNGQAGRPDETWTEQAGVIQSEPEEGVVWFGSSGMTLDPRGKVEEVSGDGHVVFVLDFTAGRAVVTEQGRVG